MNRIKKLIALISATAFLLANYSSTSAFNRHDHDKYMIDVLFKLFKNVENDHSIEKEIQALESASYLCIDQYNGNGESDLVFLEQYGVKDLPSSISKIDYTAGYNHRRATHRGWDGESTAVYNTTDRERWVIRKSILLNTTDEIFDFNGSDAKHDSFSALIYYIHILGDRISDQKYYSEAEIMEVGGRTDKEDIAHELIHHIEILFSDQKYTNKFIHVISKIEAYNDKISALYRKNHNTISEEDFDEYKKYTEGIMEVLHCNLPEMLKDEDFFKEVFY